MGPLTYKVFNLYSFIRCRTYNSHLYTTTLPLKCESINSSCSPFKRKLLLALYRRCWVLRKRTDTACTDVAAFCANGSAASVVPFVEPGLWYHYWVTGGPSTSRLEQPYKQERRHTLTQNLKATGLWVLLLIRCSTFTLLSDLGHITHTCTQQHLPLCRKICETHSVVSLLSTFFFPTQKSTP